MSTESVVDDHGDFADPRVQILDAALELVPELGFTEEALRQAAEQQGLSAVCSGMFPDGAVELVHHHVELCDRDLIATLEQMELDGVRPLDLLKMAIKMRLEYNVPVMSQWPQAVALMALPPNTASSLTLLQTFVSDLLYALRMHFTDFQWYSKRVEVAALYVATEVHMLTDTSENYQATWDFLDKRLEEYRYLEELRQKALDSVGVLWPH